MVTLLNLLKSHFNCIIIIITRNHETNIECLPFILQNIFEKGV